MSLHLRFLITTISTNQALIINTVSTALWNNNKVAVAMAISVWAINVVFLIQGRSRLLPSIAEHMGSRKYCLATDAAQVGDQFQLF